MLRQAITTTYLLIPSVRVVHNVSSPVAFTDHVGAYYAQKVKKLNHFGCRPQQIVVIATVYFHFVISKKK